jgi:hypothetical protein
MENDQDLKTILSYIHSELNRIETMAGTLSSIEREHYNKLTKLTSNPEIHDSKFNIFVNQFFDDRELVDLAVEEQNAARQLETMKHMCLAMAQKIEGIKNAMDRGKPGESAHRAETH